MQASFASFVLLGKVLLQHKKQNKAKQAKSKNEVGGGDGGGGSTQQIRPNNQHSCTFVFFPSSELLKYTRCVFLA